MTDERVDLGFAYETTDAVRCEWCGSDPGQPCHMEPGRSDVVIFDRDFPHRRRMYHTCRIDPTSEPIGRSFQKGMFIFTERPAQPKEEP